MKKLGEIGKITPNLVGPFVERLTDSHIRVRLDACQAAAKLNPHPKAIIDALVYVVEKDGSTDARCMALDSLATLGDCSKEVCAWLASLLSRVISGQMLVWRLCRACLWFVYTRSLTFLCFV